MKNGVDKDRLSSQGFGETKTRVSDEEIAKMATEEEKEAGHQKKQKNRIQCTWYRFRSKEKIASQLKITESIRHWRMLSPFIHHPHE
ncbi:MAG: hypothetical protein IPP34_12305 [Bacteroidetes bacterium]|nr:hypothetical protein [Bacteroidota bacterium]